MFYPYPRTPHLGGASADTGDGDRRVTVDNLVSGPKVNLVIQEKVDGSNVSLHFEDDWVPILQKRAGIIDRGERQPQYGVFKSWVNENLVNLWEICEKKYVIYGEWLWATHSVKYNKLPCYFVAFDVLEKATGKFLSYKKLCELIDDRIPVVPLLHFEELDSRQLIQTLESTALAQITRSKFGEETAEGVYIRIEDEDYVKDRVKLRRQTFSCGRDDFGSGKVTNSLLDDE